MQSDNFSDIRNNCGKVLDYLRELGNFTQPPRSDFERAATWWHYGSQIRELPGIRLNEPVGNEEAWLVVARQQKTAPPPLPDPLKKWVNDHDNPEKELVPEKKREVIYDGDLENISASPDGTGRPVVLLWQDDAPANRAWKVYLPKWRKWRDSEGPKRRAIRIYERLHGDHLAMEGKRESGPLEILFGMGIVKKYSSEGLECNCIVVEQAADIELDAGNADLIVRPRRRRRPAVSLGHFRENPKLDEVRRALGEKLANDDWELNPHDESSFLSIVNEARAYLDASAEIRRDVNPLDDKPEQLTFYPEWVVVVRNREESGILSNVIKSFKGKVDAAKSLNDLPDALVRAAGEMSGANSWAEKNPMPFRGRFGEPPQKGGAGLLPPDVEKLYFPLPHNEEQRLIMARLQRPECRGVIVQGPPGTGKSHTIANIISHCLATGQKVLVASHASPALEVIREQLPKGIRTFAIPVLSSEEKSRKEIMSALNALSETRAETDLSAISAKIECMEKEAEQLRCGDLPRMRDEMRRLAERQLSSLPDMLTDGLAEPSLAQLAIWTVDNRNHLGWFKDSPKVETLESMPVDDSDIRLLRDVRRALGDDLSLTMLGVATFNETSANGQPDIQQVRQDRMEAEGVPWIAPLLRGRLAGDAELSHWSECRNELRDLARQRDGIAKKPVSHPNLEATLSNEVVDALEKKSKFFTLPVMSGDVRKILDGFQVEGRKPRRMSDWRLARDYIHWLRECRAFAARWNANIAPNLSGRGARMPKSPKQYFNWIGKSDEALRRMESVLEAIGKWRGQVNKIAEKIKRAGAPRWADELRTRPVDGDDSLLPENWRDAWKWGCANRHLDNTDGAKRMRQLADEILNRENHLARLMGEIVEKRAAEAITRELGQDYEADSNLSKFRTAMREMPKTPGAKKAPRYRNMAQKAMEKCHRAIPCWIMPSWRANEMLPAELGAFDLVIVDEASQSDITEIATLLRGKRVLVVGDNQQVSPSSVGQKEEDIENLWKAHVGGIEGGRILQPPHSLYDFAESAYPGVIMLREHFRCAEPIVTFCSREFYEGKIQALRVPKATERLSPPLISVHVPNGYRNGDYNELEARGIVQEIGKVICDPRTASRTIGIVSLIGEEQARRIDEMARREFEERVLKERKFECGNAAHFQGKERDIVFLSMVASPGMGQSLTSRVNEQRFNVAVSRARDRLYLFHSIGLDELDRPHDLRRRLLGHFHNPMPEERAKDLRDRCESNFEREFFDRLSAAGYAVTPQVGSIGYRIDIVVEGETGARLAVELDGDRFHQDWAKDYARQRNLERVGWRFWRCFYSSYCRDRNGVFADLISTLQSLGIKPWNYSEESSNRFTEFRIYDPKQERGDDDIAQQSENAGDEGESTDRRECAKKRGVGQGSH